MRKKLKNGYAEGRQDGYASMHERPPSLIPRWLLPFVFLLLICGIATVYLVLEIVNKKFSSYLFGSEELSYDGAYSGLAGLSFGKNYDALPSYNASDFKQVIHIPGVKALTVWKDAEARDCLASRSLDKRSQSSYEFVNEVIALFGSSFAEFARFEFSSEYSPFVKVLYVEDVTSDESPEVLVNIRDKSGDKITCFDISGNELYSISGDYSESDEFYLIQSPLSKGEAAVLFSNKGDKHNHFRVYSANDGARRQEDEAEFIATLGYFGFYTIDPIIVDWDGDGISDHFFTANLVRGNRDKLAPLIGGKFLDYIDPGDLNLYPPNAIYQYEHPQRGRMIVFAMNNAVSKSKGGGTQFNADDYYDGNEIFWRSFDDAIEGSRHFKGKHVTLAEKSILLADLTGDGAPEICALVTGNIFVVMDLIGNELFKKKFFKKLEPYTSPAELVSGDFDCDGYTDVAFIYENGIFIPDLDEIRKK